MTLEELVARMDDNAYQQMRTAIEIGKWPDGRALSEDDKGFCMQAVILYENKTKSAEQHTGYVAEKNPDCDSLKPGGGDPEDDTLHWVD